MEGIILVKLLFWRNMIPNSRLSDYPKATNHYAADNGKSVITKTRGITKDAHQWVRSIILPDYFYNHITVKGLSHMKNCVLGLSFWLSG